ncbi:hypothetical protein O1L60_03295 [Streptomyces diastatochromogenes]|nr:hypothetical protein [Streptomyces diastatochromogenes]
MTHEKPDTAAGAARAGRRRRRPREEGPEADASGPSAGLPLALVGSACAAAFALWGWRRRTATQRG